MQQKTKTAALLFFTVSTVIVTVFGPEALTKYQDRERLNKIHTETADASAEGYLYKLNPNEKLYILSRCLNSQIRPESEQSYLTHSDNSIVYPDSEGTYAFVANYRSPLEQEITDEQIYASCNDALALLKSAGIVPDEIQDIDPALYDATLYSAIDVLEPRNNMAVWMLNFSDNSGNIDKQNRLIDACIDAEDGKIYEFYVRTSLKWEEIDADRIIEEWSRYMELNAPSPYESENPLLETTPFYKKYIFSGMDEDFTIVTIGFYEGINELYLKISR